MASVMSYCQLGNYAARSHSAEQAPSHINAVLIIQSAPMNGWTDGKSYSNICWLRLLSQDSHCVSELRRFCREFNRNRVIYAWQVQQLLSYLFTFQHCIFQNAAAVFVRQTQLVIHPSIDEIRLRDVRLVKFIFIVSTGRWNTKTCHFIIMDVK